MEIDVKALEIINFYEQLGWDSLLFEDKHYLVNSKLEGLDYRVINLVSKFSNGTVAVGGARIPVEYYNYLHSIGQNYIEVVCLAR